MLFSKTFVFINSISVFSYRAINIFRVHFKTSKSVQLKNYTVWKCNITTHNENLLNSIFFVSENLYFTKLFNFTKSSQQKFLIKKLNMEFVYKKLLKCLVTSQLNVYCCFFMQSSCKSVCIWKYCLKYIV